MITKCISYNKPYKFHHCDGHRARFDLGNSAASLNFNCHPSFVDTDRAHSLTIVTNTMTELPGTDGLPVQSLRLNTTVDLHN